MELCLNGSDKSAHYFLMQQLDNSNQDFGEAILSHKLTVKDEQRLMTY